MSSLWLVLFPDVVHAQFPNLALNRPVYASSATANLPSFAVDGNAATRWESQSSDPQWLYVDLGTSRFIIYVQLSWNAAYGKDYLIQVSDDAVNWVTIKTVTANSALTNGLGPLSGSGRYVRVYGTSRGTVNGYSLNEFEVYSYPDVPLAIITSPTNNSTYAIGSSVPIAADAIPLAGNTIVKVEFYNGATLIGTDNTEPYSFDWTGLVAGTYSITVRATDNTNAVAVSDPVTITVTDLSGGSCASPAWNAGTVYSSAGSQVTAGGRAYSNRWYTVGQDPVGNSGQNEVWQLISTCGTGTTVAITSPGIINRFQALASIDIYVDALANSGYRIKNVVIYNGSTPLHTDTSSSFSYKWNDVPVGTYTLTAVATDNLGVSVTSAAVTVDVVAGSGCDAPAWQAGTVYGNAGAQVSYQGSLYQNNWYSQGQNPASNSGQYQVWTLITTCPTGVSVSLTSPADGTTYSAPATIPIVATASIASGSISKVEFYQNDALLNSDVLPPYAYNWVGVTVGTYTLAAKVYDAAGAITVSPSIIAKVVPAAGIYAWTGIGGTSEWNNPANWSPSGVPGSSDAVIIASGISFPKLLTNTTVANFTINSDSLDLNGQQLTITGTANLNGGKINNGIVNIQCVQAQFAGTVFSANVALTTTCSNILFNGSVFNGTASFTKEGPQASDNDGAGGTVFNGATAISNNSDSRLRMGSSSSDVFNGDITFNNNRTAAFEVGYNANARFAGNISLSSNSNVTFGAGTGAAIFDSTKPQTISLGGVAALIFNRLAINKSASDVTLTTPVKVNTALVLTKGKIVSAAAAELIFDPAATVSGVSNASFVSGPVIKEGAGSFIFPIGKNGSYRPIAIAPNGVPSDAFVAEYFPVASSFDSSFKELSINHISSCEYWILNRFVGNTGTAVTLSWDSTSCGITNMAELLVARWDGSKWANQGNGGITGTNAEGTVTTLGAVNSFSPFTLASGTTDNPLPVKLISFTATGKPGKILLQWVTTEEFHNKGFEIQRSADGTAFKTISYVNAVTGNAITKSYSTYDYAPLSGVSYYRLKQIDIDEKATYSYIVSVKRELLRPVIRLTPNPVAGRASLGIRLLASSHCTVQLFNDRGQEIFVKDLGMVQSETISLDFSAYPAGIYFITVKNPHGTLYREKIIKY